MSAIVFTITVNNDTLKYYTRFSKKIYLILRLNLGAVHFSMTKMLVLPNSREMYKSLCT